MKLRHSGLFALALVCALAGRAAAQPAVRVLGVEPPPEVGAELAKLRDWRDVRTAVRILGELDIAAPYIRAELGRAPTPRHRRDLQEALDAIEARAYDRTLRRAARWVRDNRIDLYTEFVSRCEDKDAGRLLVAASRQWASIHQDAAGILSRAAPKVVPFGFGDLTAHSRHLRGHDLHVEQGMLNAEVVRANNCRLDAWERAYSAVVVRGELTDLPNPAGCNGFWFHSVGLLNRPHHLGQCDYSLIVVDGDLELTTGVRYSVLIVNGNIHTDNRPGGGGVPDSSLVAATGNIELPWGGDKNLYLAGGVCRTKLSRSSAAREKQKSLPFGIRFLDPVEFGLKLAAQNGGIQVMGIAPGCVFARHGVEDADVILSMDDKEVDTVADFRRALRRGVIQESVTLRIKRGDARLTRIVFLDDVPAPTAPPPRPKP